MNKRLESIKTEKPFMLWDIAVAVLLIAALVLTLVFLLSPKKGGTVKIYVDNELYGEYVLSENRTVEISGEGYKNVVEISGGKVKMREASCGNQLCVHHSEISSAGEEIVCLPNRVVVVIDGEDGLDAST
jgi:Uncharacterized protein conserved in bacteria